MPGNSQNAGTINLPKFCSGFGQYHSEKHETNPQKYIGITMEKILSMAENPPSVVKNQAQWVIPSTLMSRVHSEQKAHGEFHFLWADLDELSRLTFFDLVDRVTNIIDGKVCIYTSRSATEENPKSRILVPLAHPVSGEMFVTLQTILNNRLEAVGITPDRATERAGQICYLPNRGDYYEFC